MELKSYYKMCKHCGNDEGCDAAMDALHDLLSQSSVLPITISQTTENDELTHGEQEAVQKIYKILQLPLLLFLLFHMCSFRSYIRA